MALKSTIFRVELQLSDLDRDYYDSHVLTIARHPSETDVRMMLRVLAFALYADHDLQLCKGISDEDEPDLWRKNLHGGIELWIELGQPDEKRLRKACSAAAQVVVLTYGGSTAELWWQKQADRLARQDNLTVLNVTPADAEALAARVQRGMRLQCTIDHGQLWFSDEGGMLEVSPKVWQRSVQALASRAAPAVNGRGKPAVLPVRCESCPRTPLSRWAGNPHV